MEFDLKGADALLVVGDSERNADLYYATRFRAPDPFVFVWTAGEKILMASDLEVDRSRAQATVDRVVASSGYERLLRERGTEQPGFDDVLRELLRELEIERLLVPTDFPMGTGDGLRRAGRQLDIAPQPLFPGRQIKTDEEVEAVRQSQAAAERGMEAAVDGIRRSEIGDEGQLFLDGEVLTSERLRRLVHLALMERDCTAQHTIIACGEQGCDPHQVGSGPLRTGETIIIDIFPRSLTTRYWGDITRTVVRGKATPEARKLHEDVHAAQEEAIGRLRDGVDGVEIHQGVISCFEARGNVTEKRDGAMVGYFHGTGHGVGLEIHEQPRMGKMTSMIHTGHTVTVEPGLYYPGVGAVRLEDTVVVTEPGHRNLTTFPKDLEV